MENQITLLKNLVEESNVSHYECARLKVLLDNMQHYLVRKAGLGDAHAQSLVDDITSLPGVRNVG